MDGASQDPKRSTGKDDEEVSHVKTPGMCPAACAMPSAMTPAGKALREESFWGSPLGGVLWGKPFGGSPLGAALWGQPFGGSPLGAVL